MKSLKELEAIRDRMRQTVNTRESDNNTIRVVVGMATCGISAGARPVLNAIVEELARENVAGVQVTQTGCIGLCQYEPIVEVIEPGKPKITYIKMNPAKAAEIVDKHLIGGHVVDEYTMAAADIK